MQDACALLECRQPLELCGAIRPVQELAALVPRMVRQGTAARGALVHTSLIDTAALQRPCLGVADVCVLLSLWRQLPFRTAPQERFIGDVCGAVFQRGLAHVPEALRQDNPADVPAILLAWIAGGPRGCSC